MIGADLVRDKVIELIEAEAAAVLGDTEELRALNVTRERIRLYMPEFRTSELAEAIISANDIDALPQEDKEERLITDLMTAYSLFIARILRRAKI